MKVVISNALFTPANSIHLNSIAYFALVGRHRVLPERDTGEDFSAWLSSLPKDGREQWDTILQSSYLLESREPSPRTLLVVDAAASNWALTPPQSSLDDAVNFLAQPFRLLLENNESDRSFFLKMATGEQRQFLLKCEERGFLSFENGGGIDFMPNTIRTAVARGRRAAILYWCLFDSDALQPNQPSQASRHLQEVCAAAQVPHYMLRRRNIENYLPKAALAAWVYKTNRLRRERKSRFEAFASMSDAQRHHYNLKHGFHGDARRAAPAAGNLFDAIPDRAKAALHVGFGADIATLFDTDLVKEYDLKRDGAWAELSPIVAEIVSILR